MKVTELEKKLLAIARADSPSDHVPYAFEQRVMARLRSIQPLDTLSLWTKALWRGAMACVLLTLISGGWALWSGQQPARADDFAQAFESAVYASSQQVDYSW